jgi:hypothetical protein
VLLQGSTHSSYIDWLLESHQTVAETVDILPSSIFPVRYWVKRLVHQRVRWSDTSPLTKCCPKVARSYMHWLDPFSYKLWSPWYLTFFHFSERSIALVKPLVHQRSWNDWTCPTLPKVLLRCTHSYIHWFPFSSHQTARNIVILPSSIFRSIALLVKRLVRQKSCNWSEPAPHYQSVTPRVARIQYIHWLASFSRTKLCAVILPSSIFPNVQLQ